MRMLEKAKNIAVIILIAFLVIPCVYTVKDSINTHNDYKNSVLVEAEVIEVLGYEKDEVVIKYGYQVKGKTYEATAMRDNKSIKPGDKETIRVSKKDSKKEKKDKSKEAENCIYSGWTPAERNLFYRKISARFFQKKSKTDIWYCWCTYAYPRI